MHKLKFADASFLYAETAHAPMNIASVQLLDIPTACREDFFQRLKHHLIENIGHIDFMQRRLVNSPFGLDQPIWVTDQNFDIDRHLHRSRLPAPGNMRQLEKLVAQLHEQPLQRHYPLWQFHLIEGLEDGRCAWYTKYHHACIDGMAGQQIIDVLCSDEPDGEGSLKLPVADVEPVPAFADQWRDALISVAAEPMVNLMRWSETMRVSSRLANMLSDPATAGAYGQQAPQTIFNATVSPYRSVAFGSLPLSGLRRLSKSFSVSVNDTFMAVCAGGIRRYLTRHNALPELALTAAVPVSLRKPGETSTDNRVSMLLANLATDLEDPHERLQTIHSSARIGKKVVAEMASLPTADPHVPGMPLIAASMAQFAETMRLADAAQPSANVVISNVPGPRKQKYLCGAAMQTHYPVSIAASGSALNITVQSYMDRMDFSITACLEAIPDAEDLRDDMLAAWRELSKLIEPLDTEVAPGKRFKQNQSHMQPLLHHTQTAIATVTSS